MLTDIFLELFGREAGVNRAVQGPDLWCWCEVENLFQSWAAQITQLLYLNHLIQGLFNLGQTLNFIYTLLSQIAAQKLMNYLITSFCCYWLKTLVYNQITEKPKTSPIYTLC